MPWRRRRTTHRIFRNAFGPGYRSRNTDASEVGCGACGLSPRPLLSCSNDTRHREQQSPRPRLCQCDGRVDPRLAAAAADYPESELSRLRRPANDPRHSAFLERYIESAVHRGWRGGVMAMSSRPCDRCAFPWNPDDGFRLGLLSP